MTDYRLEQIVGNLLRAGVTLAAVVVLAGGVWYLLQSGTDMPAYHVFHAEVRGIHALAALPGPQALMLAGLILLIATPVARVVFCLVAFALERDHAYVWITLVVLLILLYSIGTSWL